MFVSEKMTRHVTCVLPRDSLIDASNMMQELNIRHLPVVENGRLVGIISDRDLIRAPTGTKLVNEIMANAVTTCPATASVAEVAASMLQQKIDAIPITKRDGTIIGIVTTVDILKMVANRDELLVQSEAFWKSDVPESAI